MIRPGPVFRILAVPTIARLALLVGLVVAVFLAESFTTLMEGAIRHGGNSQHVAALLAYKAPEIIDLALALGVLIALYFALNDTRQRGELVILATSGVRWTRIMWFAIWLGAVGGLLSVLVSGYLVPAARYGERITKAELRKDYVLAQVLEVGPRNTLQTINDITFIATPPRDVDQERGKLFAFQKHPSGSWRAGQSHDWTVTGPNADGSYRLHMNETTAYEGLPSGERAMPISVFRARNTGLDFEMQKIISEVSKLRQSWERPLIVGAVSLQRLAEVLSRAILVPTAALLALAAVLAAGRGLMRFVSLPLAAVLLLFYDVLGRTLVLETVGSLPFLNLVLLTMLAYLGPPLAYVLLRGEDIMIPVRGDA